MITMPLRSIPTRMVGDENHHSEDVSQEVGQGLGDAGQQHR
jgi:hypothetical protein